MTFVTALSFLALGVYPVGASAINSITFLLSVNDTRATCFQTIKTDSITRAQNETVKVGQCDAGPITWDNAADGGVQVTFYSSVIEDAPPPTCTIAGPLNYSNPASTLPGSSPILPHCFIMDSREGYHMTGFWFTALTWE